MSDIIPIEYQTPEGLRTLANFLRSQNGVKVRTAIEHDKRVDYFKGKKMIECLLYPENVKWPKTIPRIIDKSIARIISQSLLTSGFYHRSEKVEGKKGILQGNYIYIYISYLI
jgi:translocation protein SEC62